MQKGEGIPIYLDYASTTPVAEEVVEAMKPYWSLHFGNPSNTLHTFGRRAREAVERARAQVASLLGVTKEEIVFTSGATEAINLAIKGVFWRYRQVKGKHFIVGATEHKAVLKAFETIERRGAEISIAPVLPDGTVDMEALQSLIRPDTVMIALMYGNNETGVIHPVAEIGDLCRERGILFLCDATQSLAYEDIRPRQLGIHLLPLSGHKLYGPKGVGALFVSRRNPRVRLIPLIDGGGQEQGLRSGTHFVPGIVGLGAACEHARLKLRPHRSHIAQLRNRFEEMLHAKIPDVVFHGHTAPRLAHISNFSLPAQIDMKALLEELSQHVALSTSSACTTADLRLSHVLKAMGVRPTLAHTALRVSLGLPTTTSEIEEAVEHICRCYHQQAEASIHR